MGEEEEEEEEAEAEKTWNGFNVSIISLQVLFYYIRPRGRWNLDTVNSIRLF